MADRKDPFTNNRFLLEIDGVEQAAFAEAVIPDQSSDPIEYRNGNEETTVRKIPGLRKYANVNLKWGTTDSMDMYDWFKATHDDHDIKEQRKAISIVVQDETGEEAVRYTFREAWISKYNPGDLKGTDNAILIEEVEIVHEGMVRAK